jgi:potassium voltage-gated channel Eag-related subfamily H protein 5
MQAVFDLFKLVYFIVFVGHFCACAWHYLGEVELESSIGKSWLAAQGI